MSGSPVLRAQMESGFVVDDPSEDALFVLLEDIEAGEELYLIVEWLGDPNGQTFAQTTCIEDGKYVVEYRDGASEQHFKTVVNDMRSAYALLTGWAFDVPGWHDSAQWEQLPF